MPGPVTGPRPGGWGTLIWSSATPLSEPRTLHIGASCPYFIGIGCKFVAYVLIFWSGLRRVLWRKCDANGISFRIQDRGFRNRVSAFRCPALIHFANTSGVVRGESVWPRALFVVTSASFWLLCWGGLTLRLLMSYIYIYIYIYIWSTYSWCF